MLTGKKILLGVTGSIAAYKSAILVRELVKFGADVKVVLTPSAKDFITPLTLSTLSKNPVYSEFVKPMNEQGEEGLWNNHVELGLWADLFVIAPCSANTLSKLVNGNCDNLLMAVYLSCKAPVMIAPAMDLDMFAHFSTTENLIKLKSKGVKIIDPASGELASGLEGKGRMEEPEIIAQRIHDFFNPVSKLKNLNILITGGPTYEAIDPVRFIGNHASGKTGIIIADAAADRGANVTLITGPTNYKTKNPKVKTIAVTSALEMFEAVKKHWENATIGIFSAAVADYRPEQISTEKIKKTKADKLTIQLVKNPDILLFAGQNKKNQLVVGFALETNDEIKNAQEKLINKNADLIVMNSLKNDGAGFGYDTNQITFIEPNNKIHSFELNSKVNLMNQLLDRIEDLIR